MEFTDQNLGQNLRSAREKKGFTQEQLAELVGYSSDAVASWEAGRRSVKPEILVRLATVLVIPVASLFGEAGDKRVPKDLLVPWDPTTGRIEICLNCLDASHKKDASFCESCGERLWNSTCEGWIETEFNREVCMIIVPPGANHCSGCGARSIWPRVRDRIPNASFLKVVRSEFSQDAFIAPQPLGRDFQVTDAYDVGAWLEEQVRVPDPSLAKALLSCSYEWGNKRSFIIMCFAGQHDFEGVRVTVDKNLSRIEAMLGYLLKRRVRALFTETSEVDDYRKMTLDEWRELPF